MSAEGSLMRARTRTPTSPTTQPITAAIPSARATLPMSMPGLRACPLAARPALIAAESSTSEVASLKSPSPSSTVMIRCETPERFAIETATASVGDRTAPSATPQGKEIAGTSQLMTNPTAKRRGTRGGSRASRRPASHGGSPWSAYVLQPRTAAAVARSRGRYAARPRWPPPGAGSQSPDQRPAGSEARRHAP